MAQFASDAFTGTSGTELSAYSGNWTKHPSSGAGTFVISNANRCRKNSGDANEAIYYHSGSPASADYTVSADLVFVSSDVASPSVCGRMSTSANTFYMARYNTDLGGGWQLYKRVAGTFTQLGSTASATFTSGTKNLVLRMSGSTIELYKEGSGTPTISATDTAISAAGKSGLRCGADTSDSTGLHIDNFSADDIVAAGTAVPVFYYHLTQQGIA